MTKKQIKSMSDYTLGERLNCLNTLIGIMHDYCHVIDTGDKVYKEVEAERAAIIEELDAREAGL